MRSWWQPSEPGVIRNTPWLHADTIAYFESILRPDMHVVEYGCGGSTLWLAERVKTVLTFETDPRWRATINEAAPDNCTVLLMKPGLMPRIPFYCDLAFIDGQRDYRGMWLTNARIYIKPGGWLVLDNANRPEYARERESLKEFSTLVQTIDRNIKTPIISKFFVTEFWRVGE